MDNCMPLCDSEEVPLLYRTDQLSRFSSHSSSTSPPHTVFLLLSIIHSCTFLSNPHRFFYKHIWRKWDEEDEDDDFDYFVRCVEPRLRL